MWLKIINTQNDLINEIKKRQNKIKDGTYGFDICTNNLNIIDPQYKTQNYREVFTYLKPQDSEFGRVYYIVHGEISKSKIIFYEYYAIQLYEIDGVLLQPTLGCYDTKKTFGFTIADDFTNYRFELIGWQKTNPSPRKTSKPNEKVLRDWLHWLQAKKEYQDKIDVEKLAKTNAILQTLQRIAEPNDKVTPTSGHITKGGIVLKYHVKDGEVYSTFEIASGIRNIETFMKYFGIN